MYMYCALLINKVLLNICYVMNTVYSCTSYLTLYFMSGAAKVRTVNRWQIREAMFFILRKSKRQKYEYIFDNDIE